MIVEEQSPFVPGARVAMDVTAPGALTHYKVGWVDKVYKNGNFTLKGSKQQYSAYQTGAFPGSPSRWRAQRTGRDFCNRTVLRIWDDESDAEITAAIQRRELQKRFFEAVYQIEHATFYARITESDVALLEAAAAAICKPKEEKKT